MTQHHTPCRQLTQHHTPANQHHSQRNFETTTPGGSFGGAMLGIGAIWILLLVGGAITEGLFFFKDQVRIMLL
jgi:hypothetical protein